MAWKITKDYLGDNNALDQAEKTFNGETIPFRLRDDDGRTYFEGIISKDWIEGSEEFAFNPLDVMGRAYGCTEMQYKENGQWKTL